MKLGLLFCWALACLLSKVDCQSYNIKSRSDCCGSYAAYGPLYADWAYYKPHAQNEFAADFNSATKCKREHVQYIKITDMVEKNKALSPCMCTSAATECHESASAATTTTATTQAPAQAGVTTTTTATTTTTTTATTTTLAPCDTSGKTAAKKQCCHLSTDNPIVLTDKEKAGHCCLDGDKCYCDLKKAAACDACPSMLTAGAKKGCCGYKGPDNKYLMDIQERDGDCCRVMSPGQGTTIAEGEMLGECYCSDTKCAKVEDLARKLCRAPKKTTRLLAGEDLTPTTQKPCKGAVRVATDGAAVKVQTCNGVLANLHTVYGTPSVLFLKACIEKLKVDRNWDKAELKVTYLKGSAKTIKDFDTIFPKGLEGKDFGTNFTALLPVPSFADDFSSGSTDCAACVYDKSLMEGKMLTEDCLVVSWGTKATSAAALTDAPLTITAKKVAASTCDAMKPPAGSDCWQAATDKGSCTGDKGAPVLCKIKETEEYVLVGIVNAIDNACTASGVFTTEPIERLW